MWMEWTLWRWTAWRDLQWGRKHSGKSFCRNQSVRYLLFRVSFASP
ncbi:unnamed protein product, partial [Tilletia laevis]